MKKKRFLKFLNNLFNNGFFKLFLYLVGFLLVFTISGIFNDKESPFKQFVELVTNEVTFSICFVGLASLFVTRVVNKLDDSLEETMKTEDNHHKIIHHYSGHPAKILDDKENFFDKNGNYLTIGNVRPMKLKNHQKDPFSDSYKKQQKEIDFYNKGYLVLPSVNVYANILGNGTLRFDDALTEGELPDFVVQNISAILNAHRHSKKANNVTIRLKDVEMDGDTLVMKTERSNYLRMLLTNRCMDYVLDNGMTLRDLYEYDKTVNLLKDSKLSNQIGINGVVLSKDGYLLVEKRDNSKTTWKNKFAQPISLALKETDLKLNEKGMIDGGVEKAEENLFRVIRKTLKGNFGFTEEDYEPLSFQNNFLGLARDLLEGGKPNLFFVVTMNYNAQELLAVLRKNAASTDEKTALKTEKLASDYYLMHYDDIKIDFTYSLKIRRKVVYPVDRLVYPRVSKAKERAKKFRYKAVWMFDKHLLHECGEALLVCFSYLQLCKNRIPAINGKGEKTL